MNAVKHPKLAKILGAGMAALVLSASLALTACGGGSSSGGSSSSADSGSEASVSEASASEAAATGEADAEFLDFYHGQWRGSVEITGQTVYGSAGGSEQMLDVNLEDDGTCTVVPLEAHADLLSAEGTWGGDDSHIVLSLDSGEITLNIIDDATLEGNAADFDIADFDTIKFDFYG